MKNLIFNKDKGIDFMRDNRLFSGPKNLYSKAYQIFSTNDKVEKGIGRILLDGVMLYEGQLEDLKPNGFGRLIYINEYTQTKCYVGFFENGQPKGKFIRYTMVASQENAVTLETQGIAKITEEKNIDRIEIVEIKITTFGGEEVIKNKVVVKQTKEEEEVDTQLIEKMRSIAIDEDEDQEEDPLEDDMNIM